MNLFLRSSTDDVDHDACPVKCRGHRARQGFIGDQRELATQLYDLLQHAALQHNRRNSTNGLALSAGR